MASLPLPILRDVVHAEASFHARDEIVSRRNSIG